MKRVFLIFILIDLWMQAYAQTHGVIANIETGLPIKDVKIYTNTNKVVTTGWMGDFYIYSDFQSITISHGKFMPITMKREEMTDTIYMLPKLYTLDEVVVWGKRPFISPQITKRIAEDAKLCAPGGFSFDFFSIFKRNPMNKKQRQKHDEIIKTY